MTDTTSSAGHLRSALRFVREALGHCSWGLAAAAALIGVARMVPIAYGPLILDDGGLPDLPYRSIEVAIAVACILAAVLLAEHGVRAGAPRLPAYALALGVASTCTALLTLTAWAMACGWVCTEESWSHRNFWYIAGGTLARGGLAAFIYANREQMLRSMRDLGEAQFERAEAERALAQTRLQTLQAQVDPDALLGELRRVHGLYEDRPTEAAGMLDALIDRLRTATRRVPS